MENISKKSPKILALFLIGSILILPFNIRNLINPLLGDYNIIWLIGLVYAYLNKKKIGITFSIKKNLFIFFLIVISIILIIISGNSNDFLQNIRLILMMIVPTMLFLFEFHDYEQFKMFYSTVLKILNLSIYVIVFFGLIDMISSSFFSAFFTNLYDSESLSTMLASRRMVSYLGHSLYSAEVLLIFTILNYTFSLIHRTSKNKMLFIFFISIIGTALTGSKMGVVLQLVFFIVINLKPSNLPTFVFGTLTLFIISLTGIFSRTIERLTEGIKQGDLSTGRNYYLKILRDTNQLNFKFFTSLGVTLPDYRFTIALEYPIYLFFYYYGIIFTIVFFSLLFLYPIIKAFFISNRKIKFDVLFMLILLIVQVNSYNGLGTGRDFILLYVTVVFIIINTINNLKNMMIGEK
ncbi:hypothetical protein [Enterococcus lemanii]|uniref:Polymerase n=1 Tax=Enterococcus lemanii TaxID=1159752 RepID=A0ABV9MS90_9ENTE|nr:hypothetical protein [Enterococcus lemanii]MBM7709268.1 hypothetical protein [Enterococcus lemanii]